MANEQEQLGQLLQFLAQAGGQPTFSADPDIFSGAESGPDRNQGAAEAILGMRNEQFQPPELETAPEQLDPAQRRSTNLASIGEFLTSLGQISDDPRSVTQKVGEAAQAAQKRLDANKQRNLQSRNAVEIARSNFQNDLTAARIKGNAAEERRLKTQLEVLDKNLGISRQETRTDAAISIIKGRSAKKPLDDAGIAKVLEDNKVPVNDTTLAQGRAAALAGPSAAAKASKGVSESQARLRQNDAIKAMQDSIRAEAAAGREPNIAGTIKAFNLDPEEARFQRAGETAKAQGEQDRRLTPSEGRTLVNVQEDLALQKQMLALKEAEEDGTITEEEAATLKRIPILGSPNQKELFAIPAEEIRGLIETNERIKDALQGKDTSEDAQALRQQQADDAAHIRFLNAVIESTGDDPRTTSDPELQQRYQEFLATLKSLE